MDETDVTATPGRHGTIPLDRSGKEHGVAAPTSVDDYIAALPAERRDAVQTLRRTVNAAAPDASETIAYGMPALRSHRGQFLVSYAAYKAHYSLFPASGAVIKACGKELEPYVAGKGTIRFPADQPIPLALVTKIVQVRFAENEARDHQRPG